MAKIRCIGIIAEDNSDFESSVVLIKRLANGGNIAFRKSIGNGCGRLRRKAADYAIDLKNRGCDMLILIHDLDRNNLIKLKQELEKKLLNCKINKRLVCIPVEEIEGWFLSDPVGLKTIFNLKRVPKINGNPESVSSPKEKLQQIIYHCSNKGTIYLNTEHNKKIAQNISIDLMTSKCPSFKEFYNFIISQKF